jgi:predicted RNA methylase
MSEAIWSSSDSPYTCLKDVERTLAFRRAIRQTVRPGDVVVDAGAGTGILSFFAASAGAAKVYAVEIDPLLAESLRISVALNGLQDRVVVVQGDVVAADLPVEVDVVVGELIETGLIEEPQVAVVNALRERGVIDRRTRLIPERYTTFLDLVEVDDTFYGYRIAAPKHEWPNYVRPEEGWLPTRVRPLTERAVVARVDLRCRVEPLVERSVELIGTADGLANGVRLSGQTDLAPGVTIGQTNALNGDKILHLPEPIRVTATRHLPGRLRYRMGGGLGSFGWTG